MSATKPVAARAPSNPKAVKKTTAPAVPPASPVPPAAEALAASIPAEVARKPVKLKLVRDSFAMPQDDFDLVATLKQRALGFQRPAKKSELLRAGLHALATLSDKRLRAALDALQPLKPGRPKNSV